MKRSLILAAAAAFLLAGCEKVLDKEGYAKKMDAAQEAAKAAQARVEAMKTAKATGAVSTAEEGKAARALLALLCASPALVEEVENDAYLVEALSGAGSDKTEARRQFLELQEKYRGILRKNLPRAGSTYEEFARYAVNAMPGRASAAQKKELLGIVSEKCPKGDPLRLQEAANGLMFYAAAQGPK